MKKDFVSQEDIDRMDIGHKIRAPLPIDEWGGYNYQDYQAAFFDKNESADQRRLLEIKRSTS